MYLYGLAFIYFISNPLNNSVSWIFILTLHLRKLKLDKAIDFPEVS